jgi:hypothetical protein
VDRALLVAGLFALIGAAAILLRRRRPAVPDRIEPSEVGLGGGSTPGAVGVVGFSTPFCLPCREWEAALGQAGIEFAKVDVSERPELARRYAVTATPLIVAISLPDGDVIQSYGGEPRGRQVEHLRELTHA